MKHTTLVLTLIVLLSSTTLAASLDPADLAQPLPTRSLSATSLGNNGNVGGNLTSNSNGALPYIEDSPSVNMSTNSIWNVMLGLLGLGFGF